MITLPYSGQFRVLLYVICSALTWQIALAEDHSLSKTFPVKASQGVAVDSNYFYAISNTKITKHHKKTGEQVAVWEANSKESTQSHFKHLNSGTVIEGKLYGAHSRFPIASNDNTVEIFAVGGETLQHETTIHMPSQHGSLTWIDKKNGDWWMCYAVYGKPANQKTKLVKYRYENGKFIEQQSYFFPEETVAQWGSASCSGGSWGADRKLYVTGHDNAEVSVVEIDAAGVLRHIRTEPVPGIFGQAIAWDRSADQPTLWGIVKNKHISLTQLPAKR